MASVKLRNAYKVFDNKVTAVNNFSMDIEDKEFIVFVGPSGCGKSTLLRLIAGLEEVTSGEVYIGDVMVNDVQPKDRDIAMVFQNYALYPHMTVYENMAFPLKMRKMTKDQIHERIMEAARMLDIEDYLERKPKALSGGQRQRVALGRAVVREPRVFLLDEPLSNLDAKLRNQMRAEITRLHNKLATTFIYVTHDQTEAMTMGTRIVVLRDGISQQIDTPENLYSRPKNKFVAGFIGVPQMNFFNVTLNKRDKNLEIEFDGGAKFTVKSDELVWKLKSGIENGKKTVLGIRPENVRMDAEFIDKNKDWTLQANVDVYESLGNETIVYARYDGAKLDPHESSNLKCKAAAVARFEAGQIIRAAFDLRQAYFFDAETELTLHE